MREDNIEGLQIPKIISDELDPIRILKASAKNWDGGYTIAGVIGNGDSFVMRDPNGIRPCFYLCDEEVVAFASERVALMTIFNKEASEIQELEPGTAMVVKRNGRIYSDRFIDERKHHPCSFERIYFSEGMTLKSIKSEKRWALL